MEPRVHDLEAALGELTVAPRLLVACDFDGTIAPIADLPSKAVVDARAANALRKLSELPLTTVAIISGRALADLRDKLQGFERVRLIGSHGSEIDSVSAVALSLPDRELLDAASSEAKVLIADFDGAWLEQKPHSIAVHSRALERPEAIQLQTVLADRWRALSGGTIRFGKRVIEFSPLSADKGRALQSLVQECSASAVFFAGDDGTDEDAFRSSSPTQWTCKVGDEETAARMRAPDHDTLVEFLVRLAEQRAAYLASYPSERITEHAFLSDLRTFAVVDRRGAVCWLCLPRLDSTPIFSTLVGGPEAGSFRLSPERETAGTMEYDPSSLIVKTKWSTFEVEDMLDTSGGRALQRPGRSDLIRLVRGSGRAVIEFAPRLDFGRISTSLALIEDGVRVVGGPLPVVLCAPGWEWKIQRLHGHDVAFGTRTLKDETCAVELRIGTASADPAKVSTERRLTETQRFWSAWLSKLRIPQFGEVDLARSALALRGLTYGPTGAIAAAATTSLPEEIGGCRNWDYRYCWPRDACLTATTLARLGDAETGVRLLDWLLGIVEEALPEEFLAPVYSVQGRQLIGEAEVGEALGYQASRPVRIGNLAAKQLQLDALGPVLELMAVLARTGAALSASHYAMAEQLVARIQSRWEEPDHGIWEVRDTKRHFVHSKLMCWYAVQCALEVGEYLDIETGEWETLAQAIRGQIETHGYSERTGTYVAAYEFEEPDAALSWLVLTRFHPLDDPRIRRTIDWLEDQLAEDLWIRRYRMPDGLPGREGAFLICGAWLAEALIQMGEQSRAERFLRGLRQALGPLGLLSEQWDARTGLPLGNYPQAFSHVGLLNCALALESSRASGQTA